MTDASFNNPYGANLVGLWDFLTGSETKDTGLDDGIAQDGVQSGGEQPGGMFSLGEFRSTETPETFVVQGNDDPFDLDSGTIITQFRVDSSAPHHDDNTHTIVCRGEANDARFEGFFEIRVTGDGTVEVFHQVGTTQSLYSTGPGFADSFETIEVAYSWDSATGNSVRIENTANGEVFAQSSDTTGLTFDIGDDDGESFTIAAREWDDGRYDHYFDGWIDYVAVLDEAVIGPDGIVEGTDGNDVINFAYTGDPDGDMIDAGDAIDPLAGPDDDVIEAGDGRDRVFAGNGDDTIDGGAGRDRMFGMADRDTFINVTAGDFINGGEGFTVSAADDYDTLDLRGSAEAENAGGSLQVIYNSVNPEHGRVVYFDAHGDMTGIVRFRNIENVIPCFTPGTRIATPLGERNVEDLSVGDRILTRDNGIQPIRWVGRRKLGRAELKAMPHLRPIRIRAGALGKDLPERDLLVSPNHRVLISGYEASLYFDESEVLIAAKHLVDLDGVEAVDIAEVTYIHFMFDQHEVVLSDGAWSESFQPGDLSLNGIGEDQRQEIYLLFPELETAEGLATFRAARRSLKRHEAALLLSSGAVGF